jgi:ParB family chromosome partitioning protein
MSDQLQFIRFDECRPGKFQPRTNFEKEALQQLIQSIAEIGIQQPLTVRRLQNPAGLTRYEIVSGERRWRAAQALEIMELPAYIRAMDDETAAVAALSENLIRADLNPIEEAQGYQNLIDTFRYSQVDIARRFHCSKPYVSHMLSFLKLEAEVQQLIAEGVIKKGHAKMLIPLPPDKQKEFALKARTYTVNKLEKELRKELRNKPAKSNKNTKVDDIKWLEDKYAFHIGSPIKIIQEGSKYILQVHCHNLDILEGVMAKSGFNFNDI